VDELSAYVGIKDGTVRAIVVDDPADTRLTAEMLGDWVEMGRTIERMTLDAAITRMRCERVDRLERLAK